MKITMIISQNNPEVIWNAFRLANMMLEGMEDVSIFLNGPSVKYEESDSEQFPLNQHGWTRFFPATPAHENQPVLSQNHGVFSR